MILNPLQYSCLENPMDRGAWWATVHRVTKSQTWLSDFTFTFLSSSPGQVIQTFSLSFFFFTFYLDILQITENLQGQYKQLPHIFFTQIYQLLTFSSHLLFHHFCIYVYAYYRFLNYWRVKSERYALLSLNTFSSVQFRHSAVSDYLRPNGP